MRESFHVIMITHNNTSATAGLGQTSQPLTNYPLIKIESIIMDLLYFCRSIIFDTHNTFGKTSSNYLE